MSPDSRNFRNLKTRAFTIEGMGRQTQLHVLAKDVNELLIAMQDKEPLEVALRSGKNATPERLAFVPLMPHRAEKTCRVLGD